MMRGIFVAGYVNHVKLQYLNYRLGAALLPLVLPLVLLAMTVCDAYVVHKLWLLIRNIITEQIRWRPSKFPFR